MIELKRGIVEMGIVIALGDNTASKGVCDGPIRVYSSCPGLRKFSSVLRLYSSFAHGAPGAGLLLMRVQAGIGLLVQASDVVSPGPHDQSVGYGLCALVAALLLMLGLWTPVAGVLAAIGATWHGIFAIGGPGVDIQLALVGIALTLLGPGGWSLDARLFGWRRYEIQSGATTSPPESLPESDGHETRSD